MFGMDGDGIFDRSGRRDVRVFRVRPVNRDLRASSGARLALTLLAFGLHDDFIGTGVLAIVSDR